MNFTLLFVFLAALGTLSSAVTKQELENAGFAVSGDEAVLENIDARRSDDPADSIPLDDTKQLRSFYFLERSQTARLTTARAPLGCPGPGPASGLVISPLRICLTVGDRCVTLEGPRFTCICRYFCGNTSFGRVCGVTCGRTTVWFGGNGAFTCSIAGLPFRSDCPNRPQAVCSA